MCLAGGWFRPEANTVITFRLRLAVAPESSDEVTATLQSLVGPVRSQPGCSSTRMLKELDEDIVLTFVAEWRERPDLERYLRSSAFRKILAVMDLASERPTVEIDELDQRWGFEFVERVLTVPLEADESEQEAAGTN